MPPSLRPIRVVLLAALLVGCAPEPSVRVSPTPSGNPSTAIVSPAPTSATASPTAPTASPSAVLPSATPTASVPASFPPAKVGDFVTPIPQDPTAAWTGIRWRKVAATSPLAHVRSVTRWRGGFVAVGDLVLNGATARTKVWVSADGGRWDLLDGRVFGATAIVVGVAPTSDGVVVLTLESEAYSENGDRNEPASWTYTGPWQTWTTSDGLAWTAHPGPDFTVPRGMSGEFYPTLLAGAGDGLVALVLDGQPLAFSRDGIEWETVSLDTFPGGPAGWRGEAIAAYPPGFITVGYANGKAAALRSADGRTWTRSALPAGCPPSAIIVGENGLIVSGETGDPHTPRTIWCSTVDGVSWRILSTLRPIGYATAADECRGLCPNGILLGNGERMLAYRGYPGQVGWTSFNGRSWRALVFSGSRPSGIVDAFGYQYAKYLTPIGVLFIGSDSAWFGQPVT